VVVAQLEQTETTIGGWMSSLGTKGQQRQEGKEQHNSLFRSSNQIGNNGDR
jgi:hypothetical protein